VQLEEPMEEAKSQTLKLSLLIDGL